MAPPRKPNKMKNDSKKFQKGKKKKKKNKNKIINKTVPVDNKAIDSEWWDIFWKKNSSNSGNHSVGYLFLFFFNFMCSIILFKKFRCASASKLIVFQNSNAVIKPFLKS